MFTFILGASAAIAVAALVLLIVTIIKLQRLKRSYENFITKTYEDEQRWFKESIDNRFKKQYENEERLITSIERRFTDLEKQIVTEIDEIKNNKKVLKG